MMVSLEHVAVRLRQDIVLKAQELKVEPSLLQAIIKVEARASGFQVVLNEGVKFDEPLILYECHVAYRTLVAEKGQKEADRLAAKHPDIINKYAYWSKNNPYSYGLYSAQHAKLQRCVAVAGYSVGMQACSWGIGQVLGENWKLCGYSSIKSLINDAYGSERTQLDMMCRYLVGKKGMLSAMQSLNYDRIALLYNGGSYAVNNYHTKIANAHIAYRKKYGK